jgi:cytochrome c oxidase cbb3-type subunit 4
MTYDEAQVISQIVSMLIFIALLFGAFVYAFKRSNAPKFERVARAVLDSDDQIGRR